MNQLIVSLFFAMFISSSISCKVNNGNEKWKGGLERCDTNLLKRIDSKDLTVNHCDSSPFRIDAGCVIMKSCDYVMKDSLASCFAKEVGSGFLETVYNFNTGYTPLIYTKVNHTYTIDILFLANKKIKYAFDSLVKKQDTILLYERSLKNSAPSFAKDFHYYHYEIKIDSNFSPVFISGSGLN